MDFISVQLISLTNPIHRIPGQYVNIPQLFHIRNTYGLSYEFISFYNRYKYQFMGMSNTVSYHFIAHIFFQNVSTIRPSSVELIYTQKLPKVLQHVELSNIFDIWLECLNAAFCFNESNSDVIIAMK